MSFYDESYYFYFVLMMFYVISLLVLMRFLDSPTSYNDYLYFFNTREFFNVINSKGVIFDDSILAAWVDSFYFYNERPYDFSVLPSRNVYFWVSFSIGTKIYFPFYDNLL